MFKIIVVLWFLMFVYKLFSSNGIIKFALNRFKEVIQSDDFTNEATMDDLKEETSSKLIGAGIIAILMCIVAIIQSILTYIFAFSMVKYDPTIITLVYIAYMILFTVISSIKSSFKKALNKGKNKTKDELLEDLNKVKLVSFKNILMRIINVSYWGYAVYLLYFLNK